MYSRARPRPNCAPRSLSSGCAPASISPRRAMLAARGAPGHHAGAAAGCAGAARARSHGAAKLSAVRAVGSAAMAAAVAFVARGARKPAAHLQLVGSERSRRFRRSSTMRATLARSFSVAIRLSSRSIWFSATSCRISVRTSPLGFARQFVHHLKLLGHDPRPKAFEMCAISSRSGHGGRGLDESIETGAGAAIRECDDGRLAHAGERPSWAAIDGAS